MDFMDDYASDTNAGQHRLTALGVTSDRTLISGVVNGNDEVAKAYVVDNPRLTEAEMLTLANDADIVVRRELANVGHLSTAALHMLCMDKAEIVRVHALLNPLTHFSDFMCAVLAGKFSVTSKRLFCSHFRAVGHIEVFEHLWNTVKGAQPILINTLNFAVRDVPQLVDSRVFAVIHDEMLSGQASNAVREMYAGSYAVVSPEVLDGLKDDPCRPVINAIARNSSAWSSTHEYLINNHKSSGIRISIAMVTDNNDLLNMIYHGTKSAEIRYWVECNPTFVHNKK
jgi:hypothetical protein